MNRIVFLMTGLMFLTGCLVISDNKEKMEGKYISENTFAQIEPGKTTAAWVKATLGDPSDKTKDDTSGSEIWKYKYTEVKESNGAIFLLFGSSNRKER